MEYQNLSITELKQMRQQIEQSKADLEKVLSKRWREAKKEMVQRVRAIIESEGYDVHDIVRALDSRRRGPRPRAQENAEKNTTLASGNIERTYIKYVDPENPEHTYTRGVLPKWMKEKMIEKGLDPANRKDRDKFKINYMRQAA